MTKISPYENFWLYSSQLVRGVSDILVVVVEAPLKVGIGLLTAGGGVADGYGVH